MRSIYQNKNDDLNVNSNDYLNSIAYYGVVDLNNQYKSFKNGENPSVL